jgi:translation initiation factor 1
MGPDFSDGWSSDNRGGDDRGESRDITLEPHDHRLRLRIEKRRGKVVTVIEEFHLKTPELKKLSKRLKSSLGCGGTFGENRIELQGDEREGAGKILVKEGFRVV